MKARVEFKKLYSDAIIPKKAHESDAGYDLFAYTANELDIKPGETVMVNAGVSMALPKGYEAQVRPRSGMAAKNSISIVNSPGTIDESYRGTICVILINLGKEIYRIKHGQRIAQMVIHKLPEVEVVEVEELTPAQERNEAGFGSTGL